MMPLPQDVPLPPDDGMAPGTMLYPNGPFVSGNAMMTGTVAQPSSAHQALPHQTLPHQTFDNFSKPAKLSAAASSSSQAVTSSSAAADQDESEATPTACLACRTKHLKCDRARPCARCIASSSDCAYVASRRGYKGPRRAPVQNPNKRQATAPPEQDPAEYYSPVQPVTDTPGICPFTGTRLVTGSSTSPPSSCSKSPGYQKTPNGFSGSEVSANNGVVPANRNVVANGGSVQRPLLSLAERCLSSFYHNFHPSHPFVLPKEYLLRFSHEESLEPLLAAARWAGSLYIDVPSARASLLDEAYQRVYNPRATRDGFLVQAMMVLIIAMDGMTMNEKAREMLMDAENLAVEIALNTRLFATVHGRNMPILEESWRRTWWDLFVIDGMIAGVHRMTNFALFDVPMDVALPCEEHEYLSGTIPQPKLLEELEEQEFSDSEEQFSSFSYRVLCGRNLGKFMRTPPIQGPDDENLARIETLLTNWRLHLPPSKRDALDTQGRIDEMMFQAHMMVNATSILLHQPHSQLDSSPAETITSCAPHQAVLTTGQPFNSHTRHVISSASAISRLVTLPRPPTVALTCHTHFFTCVLTLSSIVHLSKWALRFVQYDDDDLRQLLRLNIGALSELSHVWPAADRARTQVRSVASEIYLAKKKVQATPHFWTGLTSDQVSSSIAADDDIIEGMDFKSKPKSLK
ncbi:Fungal Zn(2)-Cys(6) binuclear cluster domain [Geosmithia morbida]|uniref:Fungal Zn(2)-Cys(6) binuclear cluster domain n=1 Tax=Geosmithia morbida TaxID=1094350 RepID=A0A9P4YWQ6_9HYPO|nr:Fungal Zn(2)-Cys(6) binuclear cluster domain [Geosmithia morbida]KAF4123202.1 Fungal Zn(2)-Cys(6) binuclear cluster domain [Geosmithia morbida]